MKLLVLLTAMLAPHTTTAFQDYPQLVPTVNLSAIRNIYCDDPDDPTEGWTGSGSLIAKNTVLTAYHVAGGKNCIDKATGQPLKTYYVDKAHDIALMAGKQPEMPYIKYSCQPYHRGQSYMAYGITGFMSDINLFRQMKVTYTGRHRDIEYSIDSKDTAGKGIAEFNGVTIPGMSGGPYLDSEGYMHGIVNAGHSDNDIPGSPSFSYELKDTVLCK